VNFKFIAITILFIIMFNGCSEKSTYGAFQFIQKNKDERENLKSGVIQNNENNINYEEYKDKTKE